METNLINNRSYQNCTVKNFIKTEEFAKIRTKNLSGNLQLSSGTYKISWDK